MRQLTALKNLIDFIWIVCCIPLVALLLFFSVYIFVEPEILDFVFDEISLNKERPDYFKQILGLLYVGFTLIFVYCFYIFRKTLRYFQNIKPFHIDVIRNFYTIGYLLTVAGTFGVLVSFTSSLLFKGQFVINLGVTPYLFLICFIFYGIK